jgi:hypothetical protein
MTNMESTKDFNRYRRAAHALEYMDKHKVKRSVAAKEFGVHNSKLITNVKSIRNKSIEVFKLIYDGKLSYNTAYYQLRTQA